MRVDLGLVLAIAIEYTVYIVYADTLFDRKRGRIMCFAVPAFGYSILFLSCAFGIGPVNVIITFYKLTHTKSASGYN